MRKKVLLLGGTGAMGVYLVPELLHLGYEVYVTSRQERQSNHRNLVYLTGNAKDLTFVHSLLEQDYDAIVDFMVYNTEEFRDRVNDFLKNTAHYLFLSSYRVYGDSNGKVIDEQHPRLLDSVQDSVYLATDEYGLTKARQEDILRQSPYRNWTILRPAITYSKERFQLGTMEAHEFLHRALAGKGIIFPKQMLDKQATMSWAGDVAKMISQLLLKPEAMGEAFTISTAEHHSWKEILGYYEEMMHMPVKIVDLSVYESVIGRPYQIKYDRMYDRMIDNSKVLKITGMRQEDLMPLKDGLRIELSQFSRHPVYRGYNAKREQRLDELTNEKTRRITRKLEFYLKKARKLHQEKRLLKTAAKKLFDLPLLRKFKLKMKNTIILYKEGKLGKKIFQKLLALPVMRSIRNFFWQKGADKYNGAIVTLTGNYNYGSVMQRWALQNYLKKLGFRYKLLDFPFMEKMGRGVGNRNKVQAFIKQKLDTQEYDPQRSAMYRSYIVGSDQVWRRFFPDFRKFGIFFLNFLGEKKVKRIGYAISFGLSDLEKAFPGSALKDTISKYVKRFDHISVRESSGIAMVKELGGEAVCVLDPTLLMDAEDYSALIDSSPVCNDASPELFYYLLDRSEEKMAIIRNTEKQFQVSAGGIVPSDGTPLKAVEEWLKSFRDTQLVVTDSFHGMVFSIINRKPFGVFINMKRGSARMTELLEKLGLSDRIISPEAYDIEKLAQPIDWEEVTRRLTVYRKESEAWLKKALEE